MSSSLRRGALSAAALAFSIASLAACGAGNNAQTLEIKPDNAATTVGEIKIQNAVVITQPDLESTGPAVISATLFNSGSTAETLDSVTVDGAGKTAELSPAKGKGKLTIPAGGSLVLGGKGNATAVLPSSREAIKDGNAQKITFTFSRTGAVSLKAFVVPAESYFEKWGPTQAPEAPGTGESTSPSPSGSATGTASPSATPTDEASASASASESASHEAAGH
ncbi:MULTISPECIES: DUF461 domain-containing protein [unclassified Streptomyces]|uniref:DUF461 domain-containing protein n=1 Tax=unclassified Streptomyces TaxID=2593676 RepID=UPI0036E087F0